MPPFFVRFLVLLLVALILAPGAPAQTPAETTTIPYRVEIRGVEAELRTLLAAHSLLKRRENEPPRFYGALRARIAEDLDGLRRLLRAEGYYAARIVDRVDTTGTPLVITLEIASGPRFQVDSIAVLYEGAPPDDHTQEAIADGLPLRRGDPAQAAKIVAAEEWIANRLPEMGYPLARTLAREVVIDHRTENALVRYRFSAGPRVLFGRLQFEGAESVDRGYLLRLLPWREGAPYDHGLVDLYRHTLIGTRLFASVAIGFAEPIDSLRQEQGTIAPELRISLSEAPLRTIAVSTGFSTSEGVGGEVSWEHRNFFGAGERLKLTLTGAEIEQSLAADFRKPDLRRRGQTLTAGAGIVRKSSDAFDSLEVKTSLGLERRIGRRWTLTAQSEATFSDVDDAQGSRTFLLAALPLGISWDDRDDLLDPIRGTYVRTSLAPHLAVQDTLFAFIKADAAASAYQSLAGEAIVLAERLHFGSITGASRNRLPANRRFFAGGGGSIRGFGFQNVGPLDADGEPLGGRSLFEMSLEARMRPGRTFGIVPFVDAGQVWEQTLPRFDRLRWSAGLGLRYFTSFAPIRFDVAFPLNRRPGDDRVQFYINLGQSF